MFLLSASIVLMVLFLILWVLWWCYLSEYITAQQRELCLWDWTSSINKFSILLLSHIHSLQRHEGSSRQLIVSQSHPSYTTAGVRQIKQIFWQHVRKPANIIIMKDSLVSCPPTRTGMQHTASTLLQRESTTTATITTTTTTITT